MGGSWMWMSSGVMSTGANDAERYRAAPTFTAGDVITVRLDLTHGTLSFECNGTAVRTIDGIAVPCGGAGLCPAAGLHGLCCAVRIGGVGNAKREYEEEEQEGTEEEQEEEEEGEEEEEDVYPSHIAQLWSYDPYHSAPAQ